MSRIASASEFNRLDAKQLQGVFPVAVHQIVL